MFTELVRIIDIQACVNQWIAAAAIVVVIRLDSVLRDKALQKNITRRQISVEFRPSLFLAPSILQLPTTTES